MSEHKEPSEKVIICPGCGKPAKYVGERSRGAPLAYWNCDTWFCQTGYSCDYTGLPIWEDITEEEHQYYLAKQRAYIEKTWHRKERRDRALAELAKNGGNS
jgi:hypothetical protein